MRDKLNSILDGIPKGDPVWKDICRALEAIEVLHPEWFEPRSDEELRACTDRVFEEDKKKKVTKPKLEDDV